MLIVEFESLGITTLARIKKIIGAIELHKNGKDDDVIITKKNVEVVEYSRNYKK